MKTRNIIILAVAPVILAGCGDDPELVCKNNEQKAEIRSLEGDLQLLREKIARAPKDQSTELEQMRISISKEEAQIAELESQIADLASERREMEKEFENYKREYPIR